MTYSEFHDLLSTLKALSPEQMRRLRDELDSELATTTGQSPPIEKEVDDQALQHRLYEAGLLGQIRPTITELTRYRGRKAVPIQGDPLSETVIRERR